MSAPSSRAQRRDAIANRAKLLDAARMLFAERGASAPFEDVAKAAGVSRTTLHRHFSTREELAAALLEENVDRLESFAMALVNRSDAVTSLFDQALRMQLENRGLVYAMASEDPAWAGVLGARTVAAFEKALQHSRQFGTVHPEVEAPDFLIALHMAAGTAAARDGRGAAVLSKRVREMLHRALFTTPLRTDA